MPYCNAVFEYKQTPIIEVEVDRNRSLLYGGSRNSKAAARQGAVTVRAAMRRYAPINVCTQPLIWHTSSSQSAV
eukprot:3605069-Pleurochrysis_carterae.AAC.1